MSARIRTKNYSIQIYDFRAIEQASDVYLRRCLIRLNFSEEKKYIEKILSNCIMEPRIFCLLRI